MESSSLSRFIDIVSMEVVKILVFDDVVDSVDDICKHRLIQSFKTTTLIPKLSAHS